MASTDTCPDCGASAPSGVDLCPRCGYPLALRRTQAEHAPIPLDLLRKPGDRASAPAPPPRPQATPMPLVRVPTTRAIPTPVTSAVGCPRCSFANPVQRVRCERCGTMLRRDDDTEPDLPAVPGLPAPRRVRWGRILLVAVLVLVTAIGAGAFIAVMRHQDQQPAAARTAASVPPVPIDPRLVTASASSVLRPTTRYYQPRNTLDGRLDTAWNSDGRRHGTGAGVRLRFDFGVPQHVVRIWIRNGFVTSRVDRDVWHHNARVRQVQVTTATTTRVWDVADTPDPQALTADLGTTGWVELKVVSIYPGTQYPDLAVTEVAFDRAGP